MSQEFEGSLAPYGIGIDVTDEYSAYIFRVEILVFLKSYDRL
jgi:hypothetical protein